MTSEETLDALARESLLMQPTEVVSPVAVLAVEHGRDSSTLPSVE